MSLQEIIIEKIQKEGPVSFRDFMEMALYYPGTGYYTSAGEKIGEKGDFYTAPCYTSLFGQMIAKQLEEMWHLMDQPSFTIVEYGAGTGILCRDILEYLQKNPVLYNNLQYFIIEKSEIMQAMQKNILKEKVNWYKDTVEVPAFTGCVLTNEVVDNFSVHQVVMKKELMEVVVDYDNGFVERLQPASTELKDYLFQLNVSLPEGFRTEINLEATEWITGISSILKKGFVMTIDYGYPSYQLYDDCRRQGTIVCYHKHRINYSPYENIGQQDITTHINFSALHHWGLQHGLRLGGFTNQTYFLLGLGLSNCAKQSGNDHSAAMLQHFLLTMGSKFKILIQQKGIDRVQLSGLRFQQRF